MSHCPNCKKLMRGICRYCQPQEYIDMLGRAFTELVNDIKHQQAQKPVGSQEPVAFMDKGKFEHLKKNSAVLTTVTSWGAFDDDVALYASPPQRKPLTDEEIALIAAACGGLASDFVVDVARAIEAAHGIKEKK